MIKNEILALIIPIYYEEKNIPDLLEEVSKKIKIPIKLYFVYDLEEDPTLVVLKSLLKKYNLNFSLIKNNYGRGALNAIRTGIEIFEEEACVIVMGDCSDDPNDILEYIKYLDEGYDCVFGSRFMAGSKLNNYPFVKLIFNRLANNLIRVLFFIKYNDITNAFKAYNKKVLDKCGPIISQHFNINAELSLKSIIRGFRYKVIPISWTNRKEGISKFKIKEMRNRYFFTILYVLLEKFLLKKDIYKDNKY